MRLIEFFSRVYRCLFATISSHISVQDSFFSTLGLVSFCFCFMFISFKFPCEDIVLDLSKICVFVSFDVCSCSECVIDVCLCSECVINVCLCVLKSVIDVCVQSVIEAVRQINTDPARTPTALAVKIL